MQGFWRERSCLDGCHWRRIKSSLRSQNFLLQEQIDAILGRMEAEVGDVVMFVSDDYDPTCNVLGNLRCEIAKREKSYCP